LKLEVECTWNEKRNKAKQTIRFDYAPKSIFCMPDEKVHYLRTLSQTAGESGPSVLKDLKSLKEQFPKSLYAGVIYYQTLEFFEYLEEAEEVLLELKKHFPQQVFLRCFLAKKLLKNSEHEAFTDFFQNIEVLKGVFPKRKLFFFEEALFFHNLWVYHFEKMGDGLQSEKHQRFILLIMNTLQSFSLSQEVKA
jgi:hypothetical protein